MMNLERVIGVDQMSSVRSESMRESGEQFGRRRSKKRGGYEQSSMYSQSVPPNPDYDEDEDEDEEDDEEEEASGIKDTSTIYNEG